MPTNALDLRRQPEKGVQRRLLQHEFILEKRVLYGITSSSANLSQQQMLRRLRNGTAISSGLLHDEIDVRQQFP